MRADRVLRRLPLGRARSRATARPLIARSQRTALAADVRRQLAAMAMRIPHQPRRPREVLVGPQRLNHVASDPERGRDGTELRGGEGAQPAQLAGRRPVARAAEVLRGGRADVLVEKSRLH